jgi:hypothetical protein
MGEQGLRRFAVLAAWAGLTALQAGIAVAYYGRGTWWHWLLHQLVGWGLGLGAAALVAAVLRRQVPAVVALLVGQLLSIVPDLQFRYARMPHDPSMDLWLGHISLHTGPSPVLVSLAALLLGGWGWIAGAYDRRGTAGALGAGALVLVSVACLLARPIPGTLADYPTDTAPLPGRLHSAEDVHMHGAVRLLRAVEVPSTVRGS